MTTSIPNLAEAARSILLTPDATAKVRKSLDTANLWSEATITRIGIAAPPTRPERPERPKLLAPQDVPRRKINRGTTGRIALLHALSHIEINAVDLAWDIIVRFADADLPRAFFDDWIQVAAEEAKHFMLLSDRLNDFDTAYGDLPAHDGLWDAAIKTRYDLAARLAIVPLVLEARGLDVTPIMVKKLRGVNDDISADILETIYRDEIGHVRTGKRWFNFECTRRAQEPKTLWRHLVSQHFRGELKPPFNIDARNQAEFPEGWYTNLIGGE